jgi:predicted dehydrogenase
MMATPLRFGVCGTAHWAATVHLPALKQADGVSLVAVQGRNTERRETLGAAFGLAAFGDFDAFLDAVDAVSFAIPPDAQPDLAERALRAGKAVILEKPVARSMSRADALLTLAVERRLPSVCFLTRRYIADIADGTARAKAAGASGGKGYFRSAAQASDSPYANSLWRKEADALLWDVGPHALSPLIEALGPAKSVESYHEDPVVCAFDVLHESGARSRVELEQGGPESPMIYHYTFATPDGPMTIAGAPYDRVAAFRRAIAELLQLRNEGRGPGESFVAAVHIVAVLEAALACRSAGRAVPVAAAAVQPS